MKKMIVMFLTALGTASFALAAVSLEITKPPVIGPPNTGPLNDPDALQGQWFQNRGVRSHEFYDNVSGFGGGNANHLAIQGHAINVVYAGGAPGTPIISFSIAATITNDLGTEVGPWADGVNSHNEFLSTPDHYVGVMYQTMMTIEFALADLTIQPQSWTPPYTQMLPEIIAMNEDDLAWYCYNSNEPDPLGQGNYYVPAWDFGDIPLGQIANRQLDFTVNGAGLDPTDPRYLAILQSADTGEDLLSNRTTSLKISDWVDTVAIDPGGPYNPETLLHSNASVFHIPEPGTPALLGLLGFLALRRRR